MRRSVLMQRVYMVVVLALACTALFTTLIYTVLSRVLFTDIKAAELLPKARAVSNLISTSYADEEYSQAVQAVLSRMDDDNSLLGAYFVIVDQQGKPAMGAEQLNLDDLTGSEELISYALAGQEVCLYNKWVFSQIDMVSVATPILQNGRVTGGVLMFVPLYEAMAATTSMNRALLFSLLGVAPVTLMLMYLLIGRMGLPLKQMRDVAVSMAQGNLQVRANDEQRGEVGQLARSLNHLSQELYRNIRELTVERNRLRQSVDGLQEGFVSVDAMGRIEHYNPALERMFRLLPRTDEGGRQMDLIPLKQVWEDFLEAIRTKESRTRDIPVHDRLIRATVSPMQDENGDCVGAVGLFTDITEQERLERTRRDYVANVSHELRSPLTSMRALLEPMREGMVRDEDTRQRYYDILLRETMRLSRLISDLMQLSRLQSGTLVLEKAPLVLEEMINDLAERYRLTAADQGKQFELKFDPSDCPVVYTNEDRVEQLLVILLDNAMKYTPEGGAISLDAEWDAEKVTIHVADTGVGIAPEDQPYVFERFYKVDKSHGSTGSGLGLSIASEMLKAMGETITLQSEMGKGSVFSFTLHRAVPTVSASTPTGG